MSQQNIPLWKFITSFGKLPAMIIPVALVSWLAYSYLPQEQWILMTALLVISLGLSYGFGTTIKFFYYKERPQPMIFTKWRQKINASAFPSIHTSNSGIISIFVMMILHNADSISSFMLGLFAACALLFYSAVSLSRIVLNKHFPADLFWGSVLAILITSLVMWQSELVAYGLSLLMTQP